MSCQLVCEWPGEPGEAEGQAGEQEHATAQGRRGGGFVDAEDGEGEPDGGFEDGQLQRGVAGCPAAVGRDDGREQGGGQAGGAMTRHAAQQQVHEQGEGQDVGGHFQLKGVVAKAAGEVGEGDGEQAGRIEDRGLGIGEEGHTGVVPGVPERDLALAEALELVSTEGDELAGEIALTEGGLVGGDGSEEAPEEEEPEGEQEAGGDQVPARESASHARSRRVAAKQSAQAAAMSSQSKRAASCAAPWRRRARAWGEAAR